MSTCDSTRTHIYLYQFLELATINIDMGVVYNAVVKISKACKPTWHRFTPKPSATPTPSETHQTTPTSTPSISPSPSPTPSISYSLSSTPSYTPSPSQSLSGYPSNTPTPSVTPSLSAEPSKPVKEKKKSFIEKLLEWLFSLFS